ncbi:hypothetical protein DCW30_30555 [Streptomyces alfalfae]|uniref:Nucleotidyltransferase family protein n=1 Tax=Streptomyces alfalfae TaxID=1642299 RepID=A0A1P8TGV9_9ACTN|nr:hypothetical protein [Streptomyces alfalfae]AYA17276.1 hypothetical protein D3X13_14360 [Streptomyces fradiae]APY86882.1 hypothetical protein A7J05_15080 [Streptomyces alfalfae]QQC90862.1 hypothetical protein I8755_22480 [Streptomyces alfalfae]QUI33346.1 hypothetical protein H9W91_22670 [Streptomyces alfalfae]RXX37215.1 hypothetical protein DCW30_30555 [Streptomyces alfalfae]
MELSRHPLVQKLLSLSLPPTDYVVAGSGPLLAHGLRDRIGDLDVVARGAAWKTVTGLGDPVVAPSGHGLMVVLFGGDIEVFDRWLPGAPEPDVLIENAEWVCGIPFCPLAQILVWKERSLRPKDQTDAQLIMDYLRRS